jgi:hypothetical protein
MEFNKLKLREGLMGRIARKYCGDIENKEEIPYIQKSIPSIKEFRTEKKIEVPKKLTRFFIGKRFNKRG